MTYHTSSMDIETSFASLTVDIEFHEGEAEDRDTPGTDSTYFILNAFGDRLDEEGSLTGKFVQMDKMSLEEVREIFRLVEAKVVSRGYVPTWQAPLEFVAYAQA